MKKTKSLLCLALAVVLALSLVSCGQKPQVTDSQSSSISESSSSSQGFNNTLKLPAGPYVNAELPKFGEEIAKSKAINSDVTAWLQVPGTSINEPVLWKPDDDTNLYYARRKLSKEQIPSSLWTSVPTVLYVDYRSTFDGGAKGLANNTCIYGHSISDDPEDKTGMLAPLGYFKDETFAKNTPYIYFSLEDEDLVWEVFAVSYVNENLYYNSPYKTDQDFLAGVQECVKRSIYTYNTEIKADDKILTFSTCTYQLPKALQAAIVDPEKYPGAKAYNGGYELPGQVKVGYYPNKFRFIVLAKLVQNTNQLKEKADFIVNPAPKLP